MKKRKSLGRVILIDELREDDFRCDTTGVLDSIYPQCSKSHLYTVTVMILRRLILSTMIMRSSKFCFCGRQPEACCRRTKRKIMLKGAQCKLPTKSKDPIQTHNQHSADPSRYLTSTMPPTTQGQPDILVRYKSSASTTTSSRLSKLTEHSEQRPRPLNMIIIVIALLVGLPLLILAAWAIITKTRKS